MAKIEYFEGLSSEPISGIFDLLEKGKISEVKPRFDLISPEDRLITPTGRPISLRGKKWKNLINFIKHYKKDEIILDKEPIWLPIIKVHAPPIGKVSFKYTRTMEQEKGLRIKILGLEGGNCSRVNFTKSISFDAIKSHKSLEVKGHLTITKYVSKGKRDINRTDISADPNKLRIVDIPLLSKVDSETINLENFDIADELTLSSSRDIGNVAWEYGYKENARWGIKFNVPVLNLCNFKYILEETGEYQIIYDVPYGHDYVFYQPKNEVLIVPFCAITKQFLV